MTSATAAKAAAKKTAAVKSPAVKSQSIYSSTQSRFASSKLIQNLGSSNDGVQFNFSGALRNAYGRDWSQMDLLKTLFTVGICLAIGWAISKGIMFGLTHI